MKKLIVILISAAALLAGTSLHAQGKYGADSAECIKYLSYYKEYYKQKQYDDATPNWRQAYKICPATASQNLLIEGSTLVKRLIAKNAKNPEYKQALVDTLMTIYDTRAKYYPKNKVAALNNKGTDMHNYITDDPQRLYEGYTEIVENNKEKTKPAIFIFAMQSAIDLYQKGGLEAEGVIGAYQNYASYMDAVQTTTDAEAEQLASVKDDLGKLFAGSKVASCENLIELYTPRLAADPDNTALAASITKTMGMAGDCFNNELFLKAATVVYRNSPSSSAAYSLYKLNAAQGNNEEAIKFMEEAIASDETDNDSDAELSYELAAFCFKNGNNAKAYELAQQAIRLGDAFDGKSYFLIGTIWFNTRCGGDEITSKAPFWVASDYFAKAKAADEELAEEANRYIGRCSAYYPETADAFMYNLTKGQAFTASCAGMTAQTTVKTK